MSFLFHNWKLEEFNWTFYFDAFRMKASFQTFLHGIPDLKQNEDWAYILQIWKPFLLRACSQIQVFGLTERAPGWLPGAAV